jgi:RimJ/RimL family protein N-acetyltransferase
MTISTKRLILRQWQPSDLPLFAELNADPHVREYFPGLLVWKILKTNPNQYTSNYSLIKAIKDFS